MDAGHDEYWTDSQVANVQAAANAGVNLAFSQRQRDLLADPVIAEHRQQRRRQPTLVSYKDTHFNQRSTHPGTATGTFQDPRLGTPPMPSNELNGHVVSRSIRTQYTHAITIPYGETQLRFWRNTSVAQTAPGQTASLEPEPARL